MNIEIALELVEEEYSSKKMAELVLWAYEKGWAEGREDLKEERSDFI